jgi:outer membrane protein TolC
VPVPPAEIALGVPADLLRRRPDVRTAERNARALSAQIGVNKADFYPSVTLTGSTGFRTTTFGIGPGKPGLHNLFDAASFEGFIGLGVAVAAARLRPDRQSRARRRRALRGSGRSPTRTPC